MSDPNGARPSRAERSQEVERRRRIQAIVAGAVVLVVLVWFLTRSSGDGTNTASPTASATPSATVAAGPAQLLAFSVTGAPNALLSSIGTVTSCHYSSVRTSWMSGICSRTIGIASFSARSPAISLTRSRRRSNPGSACRRAS